MDPLMYDGTYLSGKHNGGFKNSFNLASYTYCYQSPIVYFDPNGKQVHYSNKPSFSYDSGFSMFPKQTPTAEDSRNYMEWHAKGELALLSYYLFDAGRAYLHYLSAAGTNYAFDLGDYLSDDKSGKVLHINLVHIAKDNAQQVLPNGGNKSYYSQGFQVADGGHFPYPKTENWQKAVGAFNVYYKADVTATANKNGSITYNMKLTIYGEDKYNLIRGNKTLQREYQTT